MGQTKKEVAMSFRTSIGVVLSLFIHSVNAEEIIFAALGDMPYCETSTATVCTPGTAGYQHLIRIFDEIESNAVPFAVHVGDVFKEPADGCTEAAFKQTKLLFDQATFPLLVIPGDNETTDCQNPLEALSLFRKHLIPAKSTLLGEVRSQERSENISWLYRGIVFVGLNVPGTTSPEQSLEGDNIRKLQESFSQARDAHSPLVIFTQAKVSPLWFPKLNSVLLKETMRLKRPVLLVHGDSHMFEWEPNYQGVQNLTRHEVIGSPNYRWSLITYSRNNDSFSVQQK